VQTIQSERVGFSPQRLARVDRLLERYVQSGLLSGILGLVYRRGEVAYANAVGMRERETNRPMTEDTIFRIYSMTKPITAVAALMLYEEGRFLLDDPLANYIPGFEDVRVYAGGMENLETPDRPIHVKDLFMHTAGLTYGWDQEHPVEERYRKTIGDTEQLNLETFVERIASLPLLYHPGSRWIYSYATDVLGRLVELLSGQSLDCFFRQEIFAPLGMNDTAFHLPPESIDRFAACYWPPGGKMGPGTPPSPRPDYDEPYDLANLGEPRFDLQDAPTGSRYTRPPNFLSGGGGLVSTAGDYLRFAQMLLNGGVLDGNRLLGRKTVEMMRVNHLPAGLMPIQVGPTPDSGYGFGLGVSVLTDPTASSQPGSAGSFGWSGAATTQFWIDPTEEMIGLLLAQFFPFDYYPIAREFRLAAYQALVD